MKKKRTSEKTRQAVINDLDNGMSVGEIVAKRKVSKPYVYKLRRTGESPTPAGKDTHVGRLERENAALRRFVGEMFVDHLLEDHIDE